MGRGRFIVFEGCDGSGKSTQARLLAASLDARLTREPGDTPAGVRIRSLLLDHSPEGASLNIRTEALLMAADRAQHVAEVIEPTLANGRDVVCDRYLASSVAYQGYGRGLDPSEIAQLSGWATQGLLPDLVVLLRVPVDVVLGRLRAGGGLDRLESEGRAFFERVSRGFDQQAASDPARWLVVDGTGPVDAIASAVSRAVASLSIS